MVLAAAKEFGALALGVGPYALQLAGCVLAGLRGLSPGAVGPGIRGHPPQAVRPR
jgi:hypothetical protein